MSLKKIQVVCPAHSVTGGPESLHNLVAVINSLGFSAQIVYFPFSQVAPTPAPYQHYGAEISDLNDAQDTLVIFPEILCMETLRLKKAKAAIWWLSLDNYRERKYHSWRDLYRYPKGVLLGRRPITGVGRFKKLLHFSKSHYDESYLQAHGIHPMRLTGPISNFYLSNTEHYSVERKNQILYNAKKGKATINFLISRYPQYSFVSLNNLNEHSLLARYRDSKLYIDFGHHPGRERMPREAAVCGCCVITGKMGAAANPFDIPIPDCFKLDEKSPHFVDQFAPLVQNIFANFDLISTKFESYRQEVRGEPIQQLQDLKKILTFIAS